MGMIATTYGYVYVAQIAMGADQAQTLKAIREAEAYPGPSLVIAYAPCINHGLKAGMGKTLAEEAKAVECAYWHLWRFNPALEDEGKNPFSLAPCINHGLKAGMGKTLAEEAKAVECAYWHLWRFNPALEDEGKNPFSLDSKEPNWDNFQDYLKGEVKAGMGKSQAEEAKAVECGYWHLWRFNPALEDEGKNPFSLDSKEPNWDNFQDYLKGEVRFASVAKQYPAEAADLFAACEDMAKKRYASYKRMAAMDWSNETQE